MYKQSGGQTSIFDDPKNFIVADLDPENRWCKMASMIPWDLIDKKYSEQFKGSIAGNPAKAARMAFGAHIIKEKYGLSDDGQWNTLKKAPVCSGSLVCQNSVTRHPLMEAL